MIAEPRRRWRAVLVLVAWASTVLAIAGCQDTALPSPSCPPQSTTWTIGTGAAEVHLDPADYPVAARAPATSIDIELGQLYMRRRIQTALESPPANDPNPAQGIFVTDVKLAEQGTGAAKDNVVSLTITPWLRGGSGQPASLQRSYRLRLKIVPYLITAATVPDEAKRRAFLGATDTGVALRFELIELFSLTNQAPVTCTAKDYDLIDANVLAGIYDSLAHQAPLVMPAAALTSMADTMLGTTTSLIGVNVGSDLDLKIGLALDKGTPTPFDPQTSLAHFPSADWGVRLDTAFVTSAIDSTARATAGSVDPAVSISSVGVAYDPGAIDVTVVGALNKCGTVHFTDNIHVTPLVRKRADGKSILVAPSTDTQTNDLNILSGTCLFFDQVLQSIANPLGKASATINTIGECAFPMGEPIEFDAGPGDHFYATGVDTDGIFYVAGRSSFMDGLVSPRPSVTPCP